MDGCVNGQDDVWAARDEGVVHTESGAGYSETGGDGAGADLGQEGAEQAEADGSGFGAARGIGVGDALGVVILMEGKAGNGGGDGGEEEARFRAGDMRGSFGIESEVGVEIGFDAAELALDRLSGAGGEFQFAEDEQELSAAMKEAGLAGFDDAAGKEAAFGNEQCAIGGKERLGDVGLDRRSAASGGGSQWGEEAGAQFLFGAGFNGGRRKGNERRQGQGLLKGGIEKCPDGPGLAAIGKHLEKPRPEAGDFAGLLKSEYGGAGRAGDAVEGWGAGARLGDAGGVGRSASGRGVKREAGAIAQNQGVELGLDAVRRREIAGHECGDAVPGRDRFDLGDVADDHGSSRDGDAVVEVNGLD